MPAEEFPAVDLSSNENPYGPCPEVLEAIQEQLYRNVSLSGINRYPDFLSVDFRMAVGRLNGVSALNVIPTCGISEAINVLAAAYLRPGDELITADPSFVLVTERARSWGADVISVPLKNDHTCDLDAMVRATGKHTRLIYLCNPHNPTGMVFDKSKFLHCFLDRIRWLRATGKTLALVILDESYRDYADAGSCPESLSLLWHYPLVVLRTFSKAYGLAGLRVGYALARRDIATILDGSLMHYVNTAVNSDVLAELTRGQGGWKHPEGNINRLAEAGALAALGTAGQKHVQEIVRLNREAREALYRALDELRLGYIRSQANFVLIDLGDRDGSKVEQRLRDHGILVRAGGIFHARYRSWLRVSMGTPGDNEAFIAALREILTS